MRQKLVAIIALPLLLSACGKYGDLEPQNNSELPPKAYGQAETSEPQELLTPTVQQRPGRSDELLRRSERRDDDEFDLAPGEEPKTGTVQSDDADPANEEEPKTP